MFQNKCRQIASFSFNRSPKHFVSPKSNQQYNHVFEELTQLKYKYNQLMDLVHSEETDGRKLGGQKNYIKRLIKHKRYQIPKQLIQLNRASNSPNIISNQTLSLLSIQKYNYQLKLRISHLQKHLANLIQQLNLKDQQIERLQKLLSQTNRNSLSQAEFQFRINKKNQRIKQLQLMLEDLTDVKSGYGRNNLQRAKSLKSLQLSSPKNQPKINHPSLNKQPQSLTNKQNSQHLINFQTQPSKKNSKKRRTIINFTSPLHQSQDQKYPKSQKTQQINQIQQMTQKLKKYEAEIDQLKKLNCQMTEKYHKVENEYNLLLTEIKELSILNQELRCQVAVWQKSVLSKQKMPNQKQNQKHQLENSHCFKRCCSSTQHNELSHDNELAKKLTTAQIIKSSKKSPSFSAYTKTRLPTQYDTLKNPSSAYYSHHIQTDSDMTIKSTASLSKKSLIPLPTSPAYQTKNIRKQQVSYKQKQDFYQIREQTKAKHDSQNKNCINKVKIKKTQKTYDHSSAAKQDQILLDLKAQNMFLKEENKVLSELIECLEKQKNQLKEQIQFQTYQRKHIQNRYNPKQLSKTKRIQSPNFKLSSNQFTVQKSLRNQTIESIKQQNQYQINKLQKELADITLINRDFSLTNQKLKLEMNQKQKKIQQLIQQTESKQSKIIFLENELIKIKSSIKQKQAQVIHRQQITSRKHSQNINEMINRLYQQQKLNINLTSQLQKAHTQLNHLRSELSLKDKQLQFIHQTNSIQFKNNFNTFQTQHINQISQLRKQIVKLSTKCTELIKQNKILISNSLQVKNQNDKLLKSLALKDQKILQLQRNSQILRNQVKRLNESLLEAFLKDSIQSHSVKHTLKKAVQIKQQSSHAINSKDPMQTIPQDKQL